MLYPIENRVREVKNLNGIWNFKIDRNNEGIEKKWFEQPLKDTVPMAVPASFNDLFTNAEDREHVGYVWYEREFVIPKSWDDKRIVLRFGSATHHAYVYVDGVQVTFHKGGFLPFEVELTDIVEKSVEANHRLTVALSNILDWTCIPCGEVISKEGEQYPKGYHYQETYFDFYNYSGLHRPVKLYTTPKKYIKDIVIKTQVEGLQSEFDNRILMTLNDYQEIEKELTPSAKSANIYVSVESDDDVMEISVLDENGNTVALISDRDIEKQEGFYRATLTVDNPHLWSPGKAYLYSVKVGGNEDCYTEQFGIRDIKVTDKQFIINGIPFYFRGFGRHEDSDIHGKGLDEALNIRDFNLLKWIGANSFRTSHYPYSEEHMMLADREGMVVIDEVPAVGMCFWDGNKVFAGDRVNDDTLNHHLDMLESMYQRDKNHPCVVMWSVANEAATHEDGAVPYFEKVTSKMRELDDTRPITIVHTSGVDGDKVSQWVDVVCINRYYGWYTDHGHTEVIGLQIKNEMIKWHEKYNKPIILSEYGADTIAGYHKLPAVAFTEEFQCEYLSEFNKVFDQLDFMIGEHVWAYCDFQTKQGLNRVDGNKKGVFTRNRQPKAAAFMLKDRWSAR
ncbi:MAG: beta-glucuronidase [Lachnospiraceae bacterium]|nr:beta-glucuronidase [Lachnospiraceae bacterium]